MQRRMLLALFACALLTRALVPAGWMPVASADGGVTISICSGMGATEMVLAADGTLHEKAPKHDAAGDHPCAFAGAVAAFTTPLLTPSAPLTAAAIAPLPVRLVATIGHGLAAPPPPPTGPPLPA